MTQIASPLNRRQSTGFSNHHSRRIERSSADYAGKKYAVYFYPRDMTPGCTAQACNLTENFDALQEAGIEILG
jgi:peroxiredoxin Q/BCP